MLQLRSLWMTSRGFERAHVALASVAAWVHADLWAEALRTVVVETG
jgi:hypothetical protein